MLAAERQAKIVEIIRRQGSAQVEDLAQNLQVSTMTIRRDLEKLQEDDLNVPAIKMRSGNWQRPAGRWFQTETISIWMRGQLHMKSQK